MALEIERKFLVTGEAWRTACATHYRQGYLCREPGRTVRVRLAAGQGFLTVKGAPRGIVRDEFEYAIPAADATALLALCDGPLVEKLRHRVPHAGLVWEVDEFLGDNAPLVVAEVELQSPDQAFEPPPWLGAEVTGDARYANSRLAAAPYRTWAAG